MKTSDENVRCSLVLCMCARPDCIPCLHARDLSKVLGVSAQNSEVSSTWRDMARLTLFNLALFLVILVSKIIINYTVLNVMAVDVAIPRSNSQVEDLGKIL